MRAPPVTTKLTGKATGPDPVERRMRPMPPPARCSLHSSNVRTLSHRYGLARPEPGFQLTAFESGGRHLEGSGNRKSELPLRLVFALCSK